MALDPILTHKVLDESYKEFLDAQFTFRNEKINYAAKIALEREASLFNGPYIEATMPYKGSKTMEELVKEGVLNPKISKAFTDNEFSVYKRYNHQEKAIKLVGEKKSIIVASGTGSGKTECFFIPLINDLLNEIDAGTLSPGIRALIVYPMNALANDQMDRLRGSLKHLPDITFGRYIGETPWGDKVNIAKGRTKAAADYSIAKGDAPLPNELLTRAEIESTPPHILVTNYAMLEYMLLRSASQKIFKGKYNQFFKFLVLDEAHTYKGAHGTEVAMLIRRLKDAVFNKVTDCLTCIGTSATLGGGDDEVRKVVEFAQDLFGEKFTEESIVKSDRQELLPVFGAINSRDYYENLFYEFESYSGEDKPTKLYEILHNDRFVYEIRKRILSKTLTLDQLTEDLVESLKLEWNETLEIVAKIIQLCNEAVSPYDGNPIINAKYHVFARALEGGFICFKDNYKIFTERKKEYEGYRVYELLNCMKCGQEYIQGNITHIEEDEYLVPGENNSDLFMLGKPQSDIEVDEDDLDVEDPTGALVRDTYLLCPKCGKLFAKGVEGVCCCGYTTSQFLTITHLTGRRDHDNCLKCGQLNKGTLRRLTTSEDAATEMLARKLYQELPAEKTITTSISVDDDLWGAPVTNEEKVSGRKMLSFSDNRQDAAKFAIFLQNRYNDWIWKNIISNVINNMNEDAISFKTLVDRCFAKANDKGLFYDLSNDSEKKDFTRKQVLKEVIELDPRMSLNRLGMINIRINNIDKIDDKIINNFAQKFNLEAEEVRSIFYMLFDMLRRQGCVEFPEGIDATDDCFEPRNRNYWFKSEGGDIGKDYQAVGFLPSFGRTNGRLSYLQKIFEKKGLDATTAKNKARNFLDQLKGAFEKNYFFESGPVPILIRNAQTNYIKIKLSEICFEKPNGTIEVCERCGEVVKNGLHHLCTKTNCDGKTVPQSNNNDRGDYYRKSFSNIHIIPMNAAEHTAMLTSNAATKLAEQFKQNKINILCCSTTFEMGVDIGSLEAVMLKNVPPETSNYIQRAGRAGRRGSAAAFILTFAKRRPHDLSYYNDPIKMINGVIKAPYIELNNAEIVRRHIHSLVFSYASELGYDLKEAADFVEGDLSPEILYQILQLKPPALMHSIRNVVPVAIQEELGVNDSWSFVVNLVDNNSGNEKATFDVAVKKLTDVLEMYQKQIDAFAMAGQYDKASIIQAVHKTYCKKEWISFLAENNVLPRYGFPIYVVPLEITGGSIRATELELDRDLRMAITEYAPGAQIVARGKYWKPYALKKAGSKGWPTYDFAVCPFCGKTYFYESAIGVDAFDREVVCCDTPLKYRQMIVPKFGFVTKHDDKESIKKKNEVHYSSQTYFHGFGEDDDIKVCDVLLKDKIVETLYSSKGEMYVINRGQFARQNDSFGSPFRVCEKCGYTQLIDTDKTTSWHHDAYGRKCSGELKNCYFGHSFLSDALVFVLPRKDEIKEYESVLYAIIEGASKFMEIDRREIGGAIWHDGETENVKVVLFDTVPNGAGHVKRIQNYAKEVLDVALDKVSGRCGCGEETCCYGCLRNYDNQAYHDKMSRGRAKQYLLWLLNETKQ